MKAVLKSECCDATINASLGDGVLVGSCSKCHRDVCRTNPRTGRSEWLDGESPWTARNDLREIKEHSHTPAAFAETLLALTRGAR